MGIVSRRTRLERKILKKRIRNSRSGNAKRRLQQRLRQVSKSTLDRGKLKIGGQLQRTSPEVAAKLISGEARTEKEAITLVKKDIARQEFKERVSERATINKGTQKRVSPSFRVQSKRQVLIRKTGGFIPGSRQAKEFADKPKEERQRIIRSLTKISPDIRASRLILNKSLTIAQNSTTRTVQTILAKQAKIEKQILFDIKNPTLRAVVKTKLSVALANKIKSQILKAKTEPILKKITTIISIPKEALGVLTQRNLTSLTKLKDVQLQKIKGRNVGTTERIFRGVGALGLLGAARGVLGVVETFRSPVKFVKGQITALRHPVQTVKMLGEDFVVDPVGTVVEYFVYGKTLNIVGKAVKSNPLAKFVQEELFIRKQPTQIRSAVRKIIKADKIQRKINPTDIPSVTKADFMKVKALNKIEANALMKALNKNDVVFGSFAARVTGGKVGKSKLALPKDVDLATKNVDNFNARYIQAIPKDLRSNYLVKAQKIIRKSNGEALLDVKPLSRLIPGKSIVNKRGLLPVSGYVRVLKKGRFDILPKISIKAKLPGLKLKSKLPSIKIKGELPKLSIKTTLQKVNIKIIKGEPTLVIKPGKAPTLFIKKGVLPELFIKKGFIFLEFKKGIAPKLIIKSPKGIKLPSLGKQASSTAFEVPTQKLISIGKKKKSLTISFKKEGRTFTFKRDKFTTKELKNTLNIRDVKNTNFKKGQWDFHKLAEGKGVMIPLKYHKVIHAIQNGFMKGKNTKFYKTLKQTKRLPKGVKALSKKLEILKGLKKEGNKLVKEFNAIEKGKKTFLPRIKIKEKGIAFKVISFGEQTTRKALGTLQVLIEKNARRAKDPQSLLVALEVQKATLKARKSSLFNRRKIKVLNDAIVLLKSKKFSKLLDQNVPGLSKEFPLIKKINKVKLKKINNKKVRQTVIRKTKKLVGIKEAKKKIVSTRPSRLPSKKSKIKSSRLPSKLPKRKPSRLPSKLPKRRSSKLPSKLPRRRSKLPSKIPRRKTSKLPSKLPRKPSKIPSKIPRGRRSKLPSRLPRGKTSKLPKKVKRKIPKPIKPKKKKQLTKKQVKKIKKKKIRKVQNNQAVFLSDFISALEGITASPAERKAFLKVGRIFMGIERRKLV